MAPRHGGNGVACGTLRIYYDNSLSCSRIMSHVVSVHQLHSTDKRASMCNTCAYTYMRNTYALTLSHNNHYASYKVSGN